MRLDPITAPLLNFSGLDLDAADRITYRLEQSFRYEYEQPVESLRHRLVIIPPTRHGDVHRRHHAVDVRGVPARRLERRDAHGNTVVHVRAARVERRIEFHIVAVLERVICHGPPVLPVTALRDPRLLAPTPLTRPDDRLGALAAELFRRHEHVIDTAERICAAVHEALSYRDGATTVQTTAAQALTGGHGVCQDFAHVMLALCRLLRVPARYVSGHLLGQGGTHAWVEVLVPHGNAAHALAFDPCNGRRAGYGHVTVATGRDYADVAPTSGTYVGPRTGRLTSSRNVGVIDVAA
jgi:transglutaminase-like putative cysteine protease